MKLRAVQRDGGFVPAAVFAGLSDEYKSLKEAGGAEWDALVLEGSRGADLHRRFGVQSFGRSSRGTRREAAELASLAQALRPDAPPGSAPTTLVPFVADPIAELQKLKSTLVEQSRQKASASSKQLQQDNLMLATWSRDQLAQLQLGFFPSSCFPMPSDPALAALRADMPLIPLCEQFFKGCTGNEYAQIMQDWLDRHVMLLHDDCLQPKCKPSQSKCQIAGMCLCKPSGVVLDGFASCFKKYLARVGAKDTGPLRKQLLGGLLVFHISSPSSDTWVYVAYANRQTWDLSLLTLQDYSDRDPLLTAAAFDNNILKVDCGD
jgi:hypothetical protein